MPLNLGQSALLHLGNCNLEGSQVGDRKEKTASAQIVRFPETVRCDSRGDISLVADHFHGSGLWYVCKVRRRFTGEVLKESLLMRQDGISGNISKRLCLAAH